MTKHTVCFGWLVYSRMYAGSQKWTALTKTIDLLDRGVNCGKACAQTSRIDIKLRCGVVGCKTKKLPTKSNPNYK